MAGFCCSVGKEDSHKTRLLVKLVDLWVCKNVASTEISGAGVLRASRVRPSQILDFTLKAGNGTANE